MPIITRNNLVKYLKSIDKNEVQNNSTNLLQKKVKKNLDNLLNWFIHVVMEGLAEAEKNRNRKIKLQSLIKKSSPILKKKFESEIRTIHFDNIRRTTELLYLIEQYLPEVKDLDSEMPIFIKTLYEKIQTLYQEIDTMFNKPVTKEEYKAVNVLIGTLNDLEKMVISLLPKELPLKRKRKIVDYTGMDSIEPINENESFKNIWTDETINKDPDYDPSEESEEEEEEDEVNILKYKNSLNLIKEKKLLEVGAKSDKKTEYKVFKTGNHSRFVYNEEF